MMEGLKPGVEGRGRGVVRREGGRRRDNGEEGGWERWQQNLELKFEGGGEERRGGKGR